MRVERYATVAAVLLMSGCMSFNERGVDLLVTKDGRIFFDVVNRVVEQKGCEKNIHCPELLAMLDYELKATSQCTDGYANASAMPVRGYVHITAQCRR